MKHCKADEYEHHEVVNDAHRHCSAYQSSASCKEGPLRGRNPEAEASVSHYQNEHWDKYVGDLLRNTKLSSQRMGLLKEEIVLNPRTELVTAIFLRKPGFNVTNRVARTTRWCRIHQEGHNNANNTVKNPDHRNSNV